MPRSNGLLNIDSAEEVLSSSFYAIFLLYRGNQSYSSEREAYWAYIAEGMGELQNWESVMKYQRKNGSLFNCPSTTAAAFIALRNSDCLSYLHLALKKFGNAGIFTKWSAFEQCKFFNPNNFYLSHQFLQFIL